MLDLRKQFIFYHKYLFRDWSNSAFLLQIFQVETNHLEIENLEIMRNYE